MALEHVRIGALPVERFQDVLPPARYEQFIAGVERSRSLLAGRVVWNVNSTARGGGVAEMLVSLLAYAHGAGVDARWTVIAGNDPFFTLTKRIHNNLHSAAGDGGELGDAERSIYEEALEPNIEEFAQLVSPDDVVIIHDPQPAGLIPVLKQRLGVRVIWRCHVGIDTPSEVARRAWGFLRPYVEPADAYVFSRRAFVWEGLEDDRIELIAPVIDAFSPKNQELTHETVGAILACAGLNSDGTDGVPTYLDESGTPQRVNRRAEVMEESELRPGDPMVLQVSRWDRLKDPIGVIRGFVEHVAPSTDAHLVYAGPAVEAVADDPEGKQVLAEAQRLYEGLPDDARSRVHLACLPMDDLQENAAIVNALQRRADVVVQKSIAEGFGLTVAEGMWKARPVVASRIGGIQDQIVEGVSGVLLDDPADLTRYGEAVGDLLRDPGRARSIGHEAQERVRDEFLAVRSLMQYLDLIERLLSAPR
ncbi:MAG TPA: glycosyltransferase [Solirubrobacteraceae bacterium]|nr:glycosyltransferase [Solirubrobacteraceae bacterium]